MLIHFDKEQNTLVIDGCGDTVFLKGKNRSALAFKWDDNGSIWNAPCTISIRDIRFEGEEGQTFWQKVIRTFKLIAYIWK